MEKRKKIMPKGVQMAVFKEDPNTVNGISLSGAGAAAIKADPFMAKHFIMLQKGVTEIPYVETRIDGPDDVRGESIHEDDDPERAIMIMGLPGPGADWTMSINLTNADGAAEKLDVRRVAGQFDQLLNTLLKSGSKLVKEVPGLYFTVRSVKGGLVTYQNINQPDTYVRIDHKTTACFDRFRVSFLSLATR